MNVVAQQTNAEPPAEKNCSLTIFYADTDESVQLLTPPQIDYLRQLQQGTIYNFKVPVQSEEQIEDFTQYIEKIDYKFFDIESEE